jgi:hypothetical protein
MSPIGEVIVEKHCQVVKAQNFWFNVNMSMDFLICVLLNDIVYKGIRDAANILKKKCFRL